MKLFRLSILLLLLSLNTPFANAGYREGNGGDFTALDFVTAAREAMERAMKIPALARRIDRPSLEAWISNTEIAIVDTPLVLNDVVKDAINFPKERKILVSRSAWMRNDDKEARRAFAFHEFLVISGHEDKFYEMTAIVFARFSNISGYIRWLAHRTQQRIAFLQHVHSKSGLGIEFCYRFGEVSGSLTDQGANFDPILVDSPTIYEFNNFYLKMRDYFFPVAHYCLTGEVLASAGTKKKLAEQFFGVQDFLRARLAD